MRYVHLTMAKPIRKTQTHPIRRRECYARTMTVGINLQTKQISDGELLGA
jgi:hypothetical protein